MKEERKHPVEDIQGLFDVNAIASSEILVKKQALRSAQNANRGRPSSNSQIRQKLHQLNINCPQDTVEFINNLSLELGKTKRALLEEAIYLLREKYTYLKTL